MPRDLRAQVRDALAALEANSTKRDRDNLARFGITAKKAFGVSMANIQALAKRLGRSHELAAALWKTGWYEARLLTGPAARYTGFKCPHCRLFVPYERADEQDLVEPQVSDTEGVRHSDVS